MVKARKDHDKEPVADSAASDLSRLAEASSKLFAEQTAAMAVMTAYGMTVAAQMTGMMLGAFRGPASAEGADNSAPADREPVLTEQAPSAKVVPLRPEASEAGEPKATPVPAVVGKPVRKAVKPVKAKAAPSTSRTAKPARRVAAENILGRDAVARELALVKLRPAAEQYAELLDVVQLYRATLVDESLDAVVVELTGSEAFVLSCLRALERFDIVEVARSGAVAMESGTAGPRLGIQPQLEAGAR